jgi:hypothetical protein
MTAPIARDSMYRRRRFETETIELCVRWYITYRLSYRDLVAMMAERGLVVSHTTILQDSGLSASSGSGHRGGTGVLQKSIDQEPAAVAERLPSTATQRATKRGAFCAERTQSGSTCG